MSARQEKKRIESAPKERKGKFQVPAEPLQDYLPANPHYQHAVRFYATDSDWIQKVEELAHRSSCIVLEMAKSGNLRTELEYLRNTGLQSKLFVIRYTQPTGYGRSFASVVLV